MQTTDPIADMLARIRNAALARHEFMRLPASKVKQSIAQILKAEGYVADVREEEWGEKKHKALTICTSRVRAYIACNRCDYRKRYNAAFPLSFF